MIIIQEVQICKCNKCGGTWYSEMLNIKGIVPVKCPKCGSPYWNVVRKKKK